MGRVDRLFCRVYGPRAYPTAVLDVVRLGPVHDLAVVAAAQLRDLLGGYKQPSSTTTAIPTSWSCSTPDTTCTG